MSTKKVAAKLPLDKARGNEIDDWQLVAPLFNAVRNFGNPTYVYFIGQKEGPLKIGLAKDPVSRLRGMQTGNPYRLRIEAVLVGDKHTEKLLHDLWAEYAIYSNESSPSLGRAPGTEWFTPDIRSDLAPIVAAAIDGQVEYLTSRNPAECYLTELEQVIRQAHIDHDHVAQGRDHVYLLAAGAGYNISRPSRI